jgi:hypothetical protein
MAEAVAFVAGLHDVAVVLQPVQQCRGHLRVAEHTGPFGEVQIRGNRNARVLLQGNRSTETV